MKDLKFSFALVLSALSLAADKAFCIDALKPTTLSSVSVATQTVSPDELNNTLDKLIRSELFMTLAGIKPITTTTESEERYGIVEKAVSSRKITNPDLMFFWTYDEFEGDGEIGLASRGAIVRLVKDKTARAVLKKYSIRFPQNAEDWIGVFKDNSNRDIEKRYSMECHLLNGIGYGYPPLEVEAFSLDMAAYYKDILDGFATNAGLLGALKQAEIPEPKSKAKWFHLANEAREAVASQKEKALPWQQAMAGIVSNYRGHSPRQQVRINIDKFITPGYARFTDKELVRDNYYRLALVSLTENYKQLINDGHTPLEILNSPQWLRKGLPPFPEELLEKSEMPGQ